jgi:hypothetical protein
MPIAPVFVAATKDIHIRFRSHDDRASAVTAIDIADAAGKSEQEARAQAEGQGLAPEPGARGFGGAGGGGVISVGRVLS